MLLVKKLVFSLPFLIFLALFYFSLTQLLINPYTIFSIDIRAILKIISLLIFLLLVCFFYTIFVTISDNWEYVVPISIVAAILPLVILSNQEGIVLMVGSMMAFLLVFLSIKHTLATYLTFQPAKLLVASVKNLFRVFILLVSICYFFSIKQIFTATGFQIPNEILDPLISNVIPQTSNLNLPAAPQLTIPPEQIDILKQNPQLLKQYGVDPALLHSVNDQVNVKQTTPTKSASPSDLIKASVNDQLQSLAKPYLTPLAILFAFLFFTSANFIGSILFLSIPFLFWLIFYILEKTGFIKFMVEMREVRKMVV